MRVGGSEQGFADFLDQVGRHDDSIHNGMNNSSNLMKLLLAVNGRLHLPNSFVVNTEDELIQWAYGDGQLDPEDATQVAGTSILCPTNALALEVNNRVSLVPTSYILQSSIPHKGYSQVLDMLPGQVYELISLDVCSKDSAALACSVDVYNSLTPSGMPPHKLRLKKVG